MAKKIYTLLLLFCLTAALTAQTVTIKDGDLVAGQTYNWTNDKEYVLDGFVFLETGGVLNIEEGTVIRGKENPSTGDLASTLIIASGAQIFATGTAAKPIIFTAEGDDLTDPDDFTSEDRAQWGGVIVLADGVLARPGGTDVIEGLPASDPRSQYGGTNNENNAGVLRYISIRHGGAALSSGNEINGLTLGGVGSGTTIEYIEVFANFDDGIEWFGGAVNCKNLAVSFCGDDGMDYDYGWRGKGQYWFVMHGEGPLEAGRGGEHDGAKPDGESPFSKPTIYNATYIGSGINPSNQPNGDGNDFALVFRDRAGGVYGNSIFTEYPDMALSLEDLPNADGEDSYTNLTNGDLLLKNNIWFGFGAGNALADVVKTFGDGNDPMAADVIKSLTDNGNALVSPNLGGISRKADGGLDPRPNAGSPALTVTEVPGDDFFESAAYKGAFGNNTNWLQGWTALSANGYLGDLNTEVTGQTITIKDEDLVGGQTYVWNKANKYLLDGFVFLEDGGKLIIEAGTVIEGKKDPSTGDLASTLIITRGAEIVANGMKEMPIIFTAEGDDLTDPDDFTSEDRAQWGGVIILGEGVLARPGGTDVIEGLPASDPRSQYGGTNNEASSGSLKYISIRHGGAALSSGNEINGLTLGGVGSGTTIEYIEVFANFDDGIEWFGGAVNCKNLAVSFCGDDGMDYDYGWRGKGQFWFVMHGEGPLEAGRAGEHDGAKPDGESPFSKPTILNATYFGSGTNPSNQPSGDGNDFALVFRDRAGGYYGNSIFTDFPDRAISIEDLPTADGDDTYTNLLSGELQLENNLWFGFGGGSTLDDLVAKFSGGDNPDGSGTISNLTDNDNLLVDPQICGISRTANGMLDPRVEAGSPAVGKSIAPPAGDNFFVDAPYIGAFASTPGGNWMEGWTALSANGYFGDLCNATSAQEAYAQDGFLLQAINPNPVTAGITKVVFELPETAKVSMMIYDLNGRLLMTAMSAETRSAGTHTEAINLNNLTNGQYILALKANDYLLSRKLVVTQ